MGSNWPNSAARGGKLVAGPWRDGPRRPGGGCLSAAGLVLLGLGLALGSAQRPGCGAQVWCTAGCGAPWGWWTVAWVLVDSGHFPFPPLRGSWCTERIQELFLPPSSPAFPSHGAGGLRDAPVELRCFTPLPPLLSHSKQRIEILLRRATLHGALLHLTLQTAAKRRSAPRLGRPWRARGRASVPALSHPLLAKCARAVRSRAWRTRRPGPWVLYHCS